MIQNIGSGIVIACALITGIISMLTGEYRTALWCGIAILANIQLIILRRTR